MTQGARGGASRASECGLLGPVETPCDMDVETLWELLQAERARHATELDERDQKIIAHEDARAADHEQIARLSRIIRDLQRATFGARSEKLDPDQLALALEELEQELAGAELRLSMAAEKAATDAKRRACQPGIAAGPLAARRAGDRYRGQDLSMLRRRAAPDRRRRRRAAGRHPGDLPGPGGPPAQVRLPRL
jgi:hypothetical protein